jgi:hypothetical protein
MPGVMMMSITKHVMKRLEKWGTGQMEQPLIPKHPDYSPKLKSLQHLSIRIKAMVTGEAVDDVGL